MAKRTGDDVNMREKYEDVPSNVASSHNGTTPTTITPRNTKLTRPAEQYPGEAERMIAETTRLALEHIGRARDATTQPRLVAELEMAESMIREAIRWSKP